MRHRMAAFEKFEERRLLTTTTLFPFSDGRPTVDRIGTITSTNRVDTYYIRLVNERVLQGNLSGMSANLNFSLANSAGTVVASSQQPGTAVDSFVSDRRLYKGQYTLTVVPVGSAQSRYRLTLSIYGGDELLTSATDLGTITSGQPTVTAADSLYGPTEFQDYFRFSTSANVPLRLTLSGLTNDINFQVLDRVGVLLAQGNAALAAVEDVTLTPTYTGAYFVRVWTGAQTYSKYRLDVTRSISSDDLFVNPTSLGSFSSTRPSAYVREYLGNIDSTRSDVQDYFRFALTEYSTVHINLEQLRGVAGLEVLDQLGRVIPAQKTTESGVENIVVHGIGAGRFMLRLFKSPLTQDDSIAYVMTIGIVTSDDFPVTPTHLGSLDASNRPTVRVTEFVGGEADVQDYFQFDLPVVTQFSMSFLSQSGDLEIRIAQIGGYAGVGGTTNNNSIVTTLDPVSLPAGSYRVRIAPANRLNASAYTFTLSANGLGDDVEGRGNQLGMLIPTQRTTVRASSTVGGTLDIQDCFRFNLQAASNVTITLSGMTSNLGIVIIDRFGRLMNTQPASSSTHLEAITFPNLAVDTYYIRIYPEAGAAPSSYDLVISLEGGDDTISGATSLGLLDLATRPTVTFEGNVGRADIQDYYRLRLAQAASLRIDLAVFASVFLIQVLTIDGLLLTEARTSGAMPELVVNLNAGAYILRVSNALTSAAYRITATCTSS